MADATNPHELVLVTDSKLPGATYPVARLVADADPDRYKPVDDGDAYTPQGFPVAPAVDPSAVAAQAAPEKRTRSTTTTTDEN